jgi:uncharacterized membrane protein YdbT with pleckstrin-like domain
MKDHYVQSLLGDREQVLLMTRQHWFMFFRSIVFELVILAVIVAVVSLVWGAAPLLPIFIGYVLVIIPIISLVKDYLDWKNRMFIITNRRVMQISGVFNKNVTDSSLEKVNDVKMSQSVWGRMFNFGDIEILTASELGANLFRVIGEPISFKTTMLNAKENLEMGYDHVARQPAPAAGDDIPGLIRELGELREKGVLSDEEFQRKKTELLSKL